MPTKEWLDDYIAELKQMKSDLEGSTPEDIFFERARSIVILESAIDVLQKLGIENEVLLKVGLGVLTDSKEMIDDLLAERKKGAETNKQRKAERNEKLFNAYIVMCALNDKEIRKGNGQLEKIRETVISLARAIRNDCNHLNHPQTQRGIMPAPWSDPEVAELIESCKADPEAE